MKGTGHGFAMSVVSLLAFHAGCVTQEEDLEGTTAEGEAPSEAGAPSRRGAVELELREHRPFFVATFDHPPSAAESEAALASFVAQQVARQGAQGERGEQDEQDEQEGGELGATDYSPTDPAHPNYGQKIVEIYAETSDLSNAGTSNSRNFRFEGVWFGPAGQQGFIDRFILDNAGRADLNRGETSIFFYLFTAPRTTDYFFTGELKSTSSDAWHCKSLVLVEKNRLYAPRINLLAVDKWIDANRASGPILYSNGAALSYP